MRQELLPLWTVATGIGVAAGLTWGHWPAGTPMIGSILEVLMEAAIFAFFPTWAGEASMTIAQRWSAEKAPNIAMAATAICAMALWSGFILLTR